MSSIARINFSIIGITIAALITATLTGIVPDERAFTVQTRAKLAEAVATNVSNLLEYNEVRQIGRQLEFFATNANDLESVAVRQADGGYLAIVGEHEELWPEAVDRGEDGCYEVSLHSANGEWGKLEARFTPVYAGVNLFFSTSLLKLVGIVSLMVGVTTWFHLRQILKYLDPSQSIPMRVQQTLDNFAEGVVIVDPEDRIVLVNQKFASDVKKEQDELLGIDLWSLPWAASEITKDPSDVTQSKQRGTRMQLTDGHGQVIAIFSVNSSPVLDDSGNPQGTMMAFTDVTPMEMNRAALLNTLEDLSRSKREISEQNEQLTYLATRDPLTGCLNRRTLFEQFDNHWQSASDGKAALSCIMVDIDFFKSINDTHGHSVGDEVLRETGRVLLECSRDTDIVCRYGGEEFAIIMVDTDVDEAARGAERIRLAISKLTIGDFSVTASLGISSHSLGAESPQEMLDEADKCLYVAKRNGRNQVVRFDEIPEQVDDASDQRSKSTERSCEQASTPSIPYSAVSALVSALTYRDQQTGMHSKRVSSYAALLAQRLLLPSEVYVVEIAALLHDIGKVGVPDSILLKPGPLDDKEWETMEKHDRIGVEILSKSFKHDQLTDMVRYHHYRFGGPEADKQEIRGEDLPVGARILTIADSFDAMISDRPYRKGMTQEAAIAELRRCAGTQFDPELVETFARIVESGNQIGGSPSKEDLDDEVLLNIGEQVEKLVDAADRGDGKTFASLAERLRDTAEQHSVQPIAQAASAAIETANQDVALEQLVQEAFGLLAACRELRNGATPPDLHDLDETPALA